MIKAFFFHLRFLWFCLGKKVMIAAVDASGSMDLAWLNKMHKMLRPAHTLLGISFTIIMFDTQVIWSQTYAADCKLKLPLTTGGGTDSEELIKCANDLHPLLDGLIIFTDGYIPAPRTQPAMKTLWVVSPGGAVLHGSMPGKALYS